ncbi:MAG: hypothetical protein ACM3KE_03715 [Hyphomicrobiales bacterium]
MNTRRLVKITGLIVILAIAGFGSQPSSWLSAQPAAAAETAPANPDPWPRKFSFLGSDGNVTLLVYQPQVEKWEMNRLTFRAAVSAQTAGKTGETFGVIWGTARTDVNKPARMVTLEDLNLTRSNFPTLSDNGASYLNQLQLLFSGTSRTIALDRLQDSLAASQTVNPQGVAVKNDPPRIIISYSPAILIAISGQTVLKDVPDTRFERVINTRALILRKKWGDAYFLHVYDGWLSAPSVDGPYRSATDIPWGIEDVANKLVEKKLGDPLSGDGAQPPPTLANGAPAIYVSHTPAELIVFKGQPNLEPIQGTGLLYASNTTGDVFVDTFNNFYYLLISGRWYRASSLNGLWRYVASNNLPADFSRIPPGSPAGVVLASVAGTPQAREAVIANSIPQTATIPRVGGPSFTPAFDGTPQFKPIPGTPLQYVVNSPTPIIRVDAHTFYALRAGVWFTATSVKGSWVVAISVPAVIYTVPPSSPLYYVTFVRVYGYTPEVVYVGYTPGYLGTVVEPDGTVVYGTGYVYQPWVGTVYYPAPVTYGVQAQPVYNPEADMAFGMAMGMTTAAMMYSWDQPVYYSSYYHGYPCCGSTSANVYGHWGNTAWSGTRTWSDTSSGTVGESASGSYTNYRTGTTGTYSANRYVNPYQGTAGRGYERTYNTPAGTTGSVSRSETYNAQTGQTAYSGDKSATGAGGSSVTRDTSASWGAQGTSADRSTTVYNANTGQTKTYSSGSNGDDRYASANGENYRNEGSGWQKQTSSGWQSAGSEDTSWADREQQARSQAQSRFNSFGQGGGWASRFGGDSGGGGWGDRFSGGGFGDRFGEGGGFGGGRFGGFRR